MALTFNERPKEHLLYTPEQVANSTLAALRYQSTLARIVSTDAGRDFVPGRGASVTVRRPVMIDPARVYSAEDRAAEKAITYSRLFEPYTSVKLGEQIYNAVKLPDDFATYTLTDMERQVVAPMAQSVADALNKTVADTLTSVPEGLTAVDTAASGALVTTEGTAFTDQPDGKTAFQQLVESGEEFLGYGVGLGGAGAHVKEDQLRANTNREVLRTIRAAKRLLDARGVAPSNRYLIVGGGWVGAILSQPQLNLVDAAGTDGLLRDATLGRLYGFTIVEDYSIDAYSAYALESNAITLATRVPAIPRGVAFGQTASAQGFTLRYLHDYDVDHLQDRAVVDTFAGAQILDPQRIVKLTGADGIEEPAAAAVVTDPSA